MSEATEAQLEMEELEELQQKMAKEEQAASTTADTAKADPEPAAKPAPEPAPVAPTVPDASQPPATETSAGDPMEEFKKKGLDTPEKLARSLKQLQAEFHRRNQKGHPGYQDLQNGNPAPMPQVPPQWTPQPQVPYAPAPQFAPPPYGYPQPAFAPSRGDVTAQLAKTYNMDPQDVERLMPLVVDAAEAIAARRTAGIEQRFSEIQRESSQNNELFQLMQDPAFSDPNVQMEMHEALKDGSLFQRERAPYVAAFKTALENMGRKQLLQQGGIPNGNPSIGAKPPVTAGGGNGSDSIASRRGPSPEEFERWTLDQQEAFIMEGKLPKRK